MATLTTLLTYPPTGFPDGWWSHGEQGRPREPAADVAARTARAVGELYSEAMTSLGVPARMSEILVFVMGHDAAELTAQSVIDRRREGPEHGYVHVPPDFHQLSATARAGLLLDAIHGIVLILADARGWDAPFDRCREHVLERRFVYRWTGRWKSAPDRRHRARIRAELAPDGAGCGRVRLEVADRSGDVVATSPPAIGWSARKDFERSEQTLRWDGSGRVSAQPYSRGAAGHGNGSLRMEHREGQWLGAAVDEVDLVDRARPRPGTPLPVLRVFPSGLEVPDGPRMMAIGGGGPIQTWAIHDFNRVASGLLKRFSDDAGRAWWEDSPIRHVSGGFEFQRPRTRVRMWVVRTELRVRVDVADEDLERHGTQAWAEHVVALTVAAVARRAGLGPHPNFDPPS